MKNFKIIICFGLILLKELIAKSSFFQRIHFKDVNDTINIIGTFHNKIRAACILDCNLISSCFITKYGQQTCQLYSYKAQFNLVDSTVDLELYRKPLSPKKWPEMRGLINYWPLDGDGSDPVGNANLYGGANFSYVDDRFGIPQSAVFFDSGYLNVPPGVYFTGDFSIIAWVKVPVVVNWARILDFSRNYDNGVMFTVSSSNMPMPSLQNKIGSKNNVFTSVSNITLNQWTHLAATLKNITATLYVNGIVVHTSTAKYTLPSNLVRDTSFIGRSYRYLYDPDTIANYDEIKIYNRALDAIEINDDLNLN